MAQTKREKLIWAWIGNQASCMETDLPNQTGLLDLARLITSRVLRSLNDGSDRFYYEVDTASPALLEFINEPVHGATLTEPGADTRLTEVWDRHADLHEKHRIVEDTDSWREVREDKSKAKVAVRFAEENKVSDLGEVVAASVYHLMRNGACRVLVELHRDRCLVMTPDEVSQEAVDRSFDEVEQPDNVALTSL